MGRLVAETQPIFIRTHDLIGRECGAATELLGQAAVFRDLGPDELAALAGPAERRRYRAGELVVEVVAGQEALVVVIAGAVRLFLLSTEGRELTLCRREAGEIFTLPGGDTNPGGGMVAQAGADDTEVRVIPWSRFLEVMASCPRAAVALASLLHAGLTEDRRLIRELAFDTVPSRLARRLAELAAARPDRVVGASREELAALVGTRPEEVSRLLRLFREEGLVAYRPHSRSIRVLNPIRLASY